MGVITISNGIYKVSVQNTPADGGGQFTVCTDSGHPRWPNQNILYGGVEEDPWSTTSTIRSFTTQTDYSTSVHPNITDPGYTIVFIGPVSSTVRSGNSFITTYTLTKPLYPDDLTIVQKITLYGTTFYNSTVAVTTSVTNTGAEPVSVGIRYLWDYSLADDDAPTFQQMAPQGAVLTSETTFSPVTFDYYKMVNLTPFPKMSIMGTANGPASLLQVPTAPDQLEYASWDSAIYNSFTYVTSGNLDNDCCVLYYWGNQQGITIPVAGTSSVTAVLFEDELPAMRGIPFFD